MKLISLTRTSYRPGTTILVNPTCIAAVERLPDDEHPPASAGTISVRESPEEIARAWHLSNHPSGTQITLSNGHCIYVAESPDEIARYCERT